MPFMPAARVWTPSSIPGDRLRVAGFAARLSPALDRAGGTKIGAPDRIASGGAHARSRPGPLLRTTPPTPAVIARPRPE